MKESCKNCKSCKFAGSLFKVGKITHLHCQNTELYPVEKRENSYETLRIWWETCSKWESRQVAEYALWQHMANEHGLTLLENEISEIIHLCRAIIATEQPDLNDPSEFPTRVKGEEFSVDVFVIDENGMHGIAFYSFDDQKWRFHTDTLVDYNEAGNETKWKWYYPIIEKLPK